MPCRGDPSGVSANTYCLYHAKRHPFSGAFLRGREGLEPRALRGKEKEEENKSRVVRARAKPDALPRGPLRGVGKYLLSLPRKRHPFSGAFLRGREGLEPRALRGKEKEEENKSRVVRARAKPDALPRGPLRGFGKYLLSLPKRG